MPKIAVVGKGGVGKTTLISLLAYVYAEKGSRVYVVDADPGANLALALGFPQELSSEIVPIVEMEDLILERTGARPGEYGGYFNLSPRVDDIPERFSAVHRGIHLLVMGSVRGPGAGCVCPENAILKARTLHTIPACPLLPMTPDWKWMRCRASRVSTRRAMPARVPVMNRTCKSCWRHCRTFQRRNVVRVFSV